MVWDILGKRRASEKGDIRFEIGDLITSAHLYSLVKKINVEYFCFFIVFGDKKQLLKALLTCIVIPRLLDLFDLLSYNSESRTKYTLRLLFMCLEVLGEGFPGGLWCRGNYGL